MTKSALTSNALSIAFGVLCALTTGYDPFHAAILGVIGAACCRLTFHALLVVGKQ